MLPPRFIVQRHGETEWDNSDPALDRINGWWDTGLDPEGKQQVIKSLPLLQGAGITRILSSDLQRAEETADIVGEALTLPITLDYGLRCWFLGIYAGQAVKLVGSFIEWFAKHPDVKVPYGETFNTYIGRLQHVLETVQRFCLRHPEHCPLLVTHSTNCAHIDDLIKGRAPQTTLPHSTPPAGLYSAIYLNNSWHGEFQK